MTLSPHDVRDFIRSHHRGVLATLRRDGLPQLSPASVCVFADGFFGEWVQAEGPASVESLPAAMDGLVRYYQQVAGEHPDWDDYRNAMLRERRVLLRILIERVGPTRGG
jgi:hypothetical protein